VEITCVSLYKPVFSRPHRGTADRSTLNSRRVKVKAQTRFDVTRVTPVLHGTHTSVTHTPKPHKPGHELPCNTHTARAARIIALIAEVCRVLLCLIAFSSRARPWRVSSGGLFTRHALPAHLVIIHRKYDLSTLYKGRVDIFTISCESVCVSVGCSWRPVDSDQRLSVTYSACKTTRRHQRDDVKRTLLLARLAPYWSRVQWRWASTLNQC